METDESIDKRRDQFELEWLAGREPLLSDFLSGFGDAKRLVLLKQLIAVDVEMRIQLGKIFSSDAYRPFGEEAVVFAQKRIEGLNPNQAKLCGRHDTKCLTCGMTVIPRRDNSCPSCGSPMIEHSAGHGAINGKAQNDMSVSSDELGLAVTFVVSRKTEDGSFVLINNQSEADIFPLGTLLNDRYRIDKQLGRGGMGEVFVGTDTRLERKVAIKFIRVDRLAYNSERMKREFEQEAKLGASLRHPSIATVYDYGFHGGVPYAVFEFVSGRSMKEVIAKTAPMPLADVQAIIQQVAAGLDFAHTRGIVHRDLKPDNLRFDEQNNIRILDFGLAKRFASHDDWSFAGTPAYASPEQANEVPSDGRTDQYSLAVTTFELLTGRRPFESIHFNEVLHQHLFEPPPTPSSLIDSIPTSVDIAITRALAKRAEARFESCEQFALAMGCLGIVGQDSASQVDEDSGTNIRVKARWLGRFYLQSAPWLRSFPGWNRQQNFGRIVQTEGVIWLVYRDEVFRWTNDQIILIPNGNSRTIDLKCRIGKRHWRVFTFVFDGVDVCRSWYDKLVAFTANARDIECDADPLRIVISLGRRPQLRLQHLGRIDITSSKPWIATARAKLRAAIMGADALTDTESEHAPGITDDEWRISGLAMKSIDDVGRRSLLARWFGSTVKSYAALMLVVTSTSISNFFLGANLFTSRIADGSWSGFEMLLVLFLGAWPLLIAGLLCFLRWPQFARGSSIAIASVGLLNYFTSVTPLGGVWMLWALFIAQRTWQSHDRYKDRIQPLNETIGFWRSTTESSAVSMSALHLFIAGIIAFESL